MDYKIKKNTADTQKKHMFLKPIQDKIYKYDYFKKRQYIFNLKSDKKEILY